MAVDSETVADEGGLVQRVAQGDERAFNLVVRAHAGRLRALALGFTGGASEADDVVQETFWSLWRNAGKWKPGGPPLAAYLNRIALNRAIDRDRRRRVRHFFGLDEAREVADPAPEQGEQHEVRSELAAVMGDVRTLPGRQRAAILLAADGELSNAEIGESMGLSVGATEQLLVRARRTLRARLAARSGEGNPER
jgi:RNA polymerase sigma-70 factor (ECF subfamily)